MGDQKQIKGLESMKHIVNSRINRLEYELKIAMEIEHSSKNCLSTRNVGMLQSHNKCRFAKKNKKRRKQY